MTILEVEEGEQRQGKDESISYQVTTTNWGSSPTNVSVKAYIGINNDNEVTDVIFPTNSPSVNGDVITLSPLKNLTSSNAYKVDVKFDAGGNTFECYFMVRCI